MTIKNMNTDTLNEILTEIQAIRITLELSSGNLKQSLDDRLARINKEIEHNAGCVLVSEMGSEDELYHKTRLASMEEEKLKLLAYSQHYFAN